MANYVLDEALDHLAQDYEALEDEHYETDPIHMGNEDESVEEIFDSSIIITKATNPVVVEHVDYVHILPSYPKSLPNGYAYVVDLRAAQQKEEDVDVRIDRL